MFIGMNDKKNPQLLSIIQLEIIRTVMIILEQTHMQNRKIL